MKPKTPKCNPVGWVWIEMCGFESEEDRLLCVQLLNLGHAYPFKRFFLRHAYGKIWFRVRQRDRRDIAWLNGPAPNHCTRLLQWLRDSKRHEEEFRLKMGWPIAADTCLGDEPSCHQALGASATREIAFQRLEPGAQTQDQQPPDSQLRRTPALH